MPKRFELLQELIWGNASPDERLRLIRIAFRATVVVFMTWSLGWLQPFGAVGFAQSDEVDDKVQSAVEPIRAQLGQITTQLATQDGVLKQIRIDQLATKLRELKRTCCLAGSDHEVRSRMEREIENAQQEYRSLTGERYPLPGCSAE